MICRLAALGAICLVLMGGCTVSVGTEISVAPDGSGDLTVAVAVDREADQRFYALSGAIFSESVTLSDLAEAGWSVRRSAGENGSSVSVTRHFDRAEDLGPLLESIGGRDPAIFREASLSAKESPFARSYSFGLTLDLSAGELTRTVEKSLGKDSTRVLAGRFGFDPARDVNLRVALAMPGQVRSQNADAVEGGSLIWQVKAGEVRRAEAETRQIEWLYVGIASAGGVAALALILLLVKDAVGLVRRRRGEVEESV